MNRYYILILQLQLIFIYPITAQDSNYKKVPLDHSVYESWKVLKNPLISNNGNWISYEANPQKGDGMLYLRNIESGGSDSISRGYKAQFSPNSDFIAFRLKPGYDTIRLLKLAKKKKNQFPKDSLGILIFENDSLIKIPKLKSFKLSKESSSWIVYHVDEKAKKSDSSEGKSKKRSKKRKKSSKKIVEKAPKIKLEGTDLIIFNPSTSKAYKYENVKEYTISRNGNLICFISLIEIDKKDSCVVKIFDPVIEKATEIFSSIGIATVPAIDNEGQQVVFLHSKDTSKTKKYTLQYWNLYYDKTISIIDTKTVGMPNNWCVNNNRTPWFSKDGSRIFFGTGPITQEEPKDTLPDEEKVKLDIWHWQDPQLQTQQNKLLKKEKKRTYLAVYDTSTKIMFQLGDTVIRNVKPRLKGNCNYALGIDYQPYLKISSWESPAYKDIYTINLNTGKKKLILSKKQYSATLSSSGKYILWYESDDSSWYSYSIRLDSIFSLTKNLPVNFFNERHDMPNEPRSYGIAGWTKNDEHVLIYDRYDIWKIQPEATEKPENITNGLGVTNSLRLRYIKLDREAMWINPESKLLLKGFNEITKEEGYYLADIVGSEIPDQLITSDARFYSPSKARDANMIIWQKCTFSDYPDLWLSDTLFHSPKQLSTINQQQKKYLWGKVELINWKSFSGDEREGLLYKPENFDSSKKYPLLIYFYERTSDYKNVYYLPGPSRSTISMSYYTSNGYLVFVPNIIYKTGNPGKSAYDAIVSGAKFLSGQSFVDSRRIGIQGQSWGGYQVAYLITQTNMFRAAMAGAPVSNMTSAYGGIRWGTGISRMFQYEESQSRIGATLWENPRLYLENSPLFYANKIETPLLIMHNDNDGAVPWHQGIELFVALRRLNKTVWMLTYNGDNHNLTKWPNRVDLSIRMKQFFDHYLKDAPMPEWMKVGIPAIKKGKITGYEQHQE